MKPVVTFPFSEAEKESRIVAVSPYSMVRRRANRGLFLSLSGEMARAAPASRQL